MAAVHQPRKGAHRQRLRSFTKSITTGTSPSSDDDFGMSGPAAKGTSPRTCFASSASSSSSTLKAKRKPTTTATTHAITPPPDALLIRSTTPSSSTFHILPRKSVSSPLLRAMQEQSPPPYTPLEFDLNYDDRSYYTLARHANSIQSVAASSSTTILPYPPPPPPPLLPYSSSSSGACYTNPCSHSQQYRFRRRNGSASGSHPTSQYPSPAHSDSEPEEGAIYYTSQRVRHRILKENAGLRLHDADGKDSKASSLTKRPMNIWSWRHWFFALAAGVVGLGDGRDDEREEKVICTTPGGICAGETETETDEPSRHLPTARIISPSEPSPLPASTLEQLQQNLIPLLFEFSRLLSIVPAFFGTIWNLYCLVSPPSLIDSVSESGGGWAGRKNPFERADFFVAALWSILTGYQCLALSTGLHTRWQTYYPPLSALIRLLALQGICWPATLLTLTVLDHVKRPVVCWCVVGTTTCFSRSVQIWVTSNISVDLSGGGEDRKGTAVNGTGSEASSTPSPLSSSFPRRIHGTLTQRRPRFRWISTERRWDWKEVSLKCVLPAGILYFVMAWVGESRREWAGC